MELLPFYLASVFEESPESYLSPSRGAVGGTLAIGLILRSLRRYGSVWCNGSVRRLDELTAGRRRLYVMTDWW